MSKSTKMTITELLPKLSPSAQAEIEKVLGKDEWPRVGGLIWILDTDGDINERSYYSDDHESHARNRIFRTREEAEQDKLTGMDAKLVAQTKINRFCEREGIENKWVAGVENWSPYFDHSDRETRATSDGSCQTSTIFNVRAVSDAHKIITACGNEIKILLSVQEESNEK